MLSLSAPFTPEPKENYPKRPTSVDSGYGSAVKKTKWRQENFNEFIHFEQDEDKFPLSSGLEESFSGMQPAASILAEVTNLPNVTSASVICNNSTTTSSGGSSNILKQLLTTTTTNVIVNGNDTTDHYTTPDYSSQALKQRSGGSPVEQVSSPDGALTDVKSEPNEDNDLQVHCN